MGCFDTGLPSYRKVVDTFAADCVPNHGSCDCWGVDEEMQLLTMWECVCLQPCESSECQLSFSTCRT